jgi:phage baseplate assembly protein V
VSGYDIGELQRQISNLFRIGTVAELDEANARVKLNVSGLTTDWLPWGAARAGKTRTWSPPQVGEQVMMASPFGDLGQGVIVGSLFSDENAAPAASKDQETTVYDDGATVDHNSASHATTVTLNAGGTLTATVGGSSVVMNTSKILLSSNGASIEISAAGVKINGVALTHNSKNVGDTHTHGGVLPGGSNTAVPN